jgi:hypothetical protein
MTMNGKQDNYTSDDFIAAAKNVSMKPAKAGNIINQVSRAVSKWNEYAEDARVPPEYRDKIFTTLRSGLLIIIHDPQLLPMWSIIICKIQPVIENSKMRNI